MKHLTVKARLRKRRFQDQYGEPTNLTIALQTAVVGLLTAGILLCACVAGYSELRLPGLL